MSIDRPLRENREQGHGPSRRVHCRQSRVQRGPSRPSRPVPTVPHPSHGDDRGEPEKWFERSSKRTANDAERARENAENHDDGDEMSMRFLSVRFKSEWIILSRCVVAVDIVDDDAFA
jgi:hypothetical protein